MADYHFVYKDVEGASTQWDYIQRKLGSLQPKPPAFKPDPFEPAAEPDSVPKDKSRIDEKTEEELEDLEHDLDDDRFLEECPEEETRGDEGNSKDFKVWMCDTNFWIRFHA